MDWLYAPIKPFVGHPELGAAVAMVLLATSAATYGATRRAPWGAIAAGVVWALYAVWEWMLGPDDNIRVDVLVLAPLLLAMLLAALWSLARVVGGTRAPRDQPPC